MRLASIGVSCVFVLCGFAVCHGQKATGPATLENLTRDDAAPAQRPVAVDASEPASWRLDGTLARPNDAFHHPDLDKAWAEYAAAAKNATDSIKRALDKQFDAATSKGDLADAERWQTAREVFERSGRLPADARSLASAAKADCTRAKDDIERAYENLIKALTMDKRIADAKAVRDEWKLVVTPSPNLEPSLVRESSCPCWGWKGFSDEEATQCRADRGLASAG